MTSLADLNKSIGLLEEKIDELIKNLGVTLKDQVTTTQLEVASAKTITDIVKELSEKIDSCPCNKEIVDSISKISITKEKTAFSYKGLKEHVPPYNQSTNEFTALVIKK